MEEAPPAYTDRVDRALLLAARAFRNRYRKGTRIPYLTHLLQVAAWVGERGGDEDQIVAAILHDYLEDVPRASSAEIERQFGAEVARMVLALSDTTMQPKPPWRGRKERYVARIRCEGARVKLVCACDKLHNARSTVEDVRREGPAALDKFNGGRDGTLWYHRAVAEALADGWEHPVLDELRGVVAELHELAGAPLPAGWR